MSDYLVLIVRSQLGQLVLLKKNYPKPLNLAQGGFRCSPFHFFSFLNKAGNVITFDVIKFGQKSKKTKSKSLAKLNLALGLPSMVISRYASSRRGLQ